MTSVVALERLLRVLKAARTADELRLAAVLAQIEAARRRIRQLKAAIAGAGSGAGLPGSTPTAGDLDAAARWCQRQARDARGEAARIAELTAQAAPLRAQLARAIGRETAAGNLAADARAKARLAAERLTEQAVPPRVSQASSSPEPCSSGTDSPGTA